MYVWVAPLVDIVSAPRPDYHQGEEEIWCMQRQLFMATFTMQPGTLEVHLECASGLNISLFRIGSPYVVLTCGGQQARSRTAIGQGLQPIFNEEFRFRVDGSTPEISILVFNQRTFAQDEELGSTRISLASLLHGTAKLPSALYAITSAASGQHQGYLRLSLGFTPISAESTGVKYQASVPLQAPNNNGHDFNPRPYPPPTSSHSSTSSAPGFEPAPYVPSFRSNQGRRPEAELREIAAHAFTISPVDWVRLVAKLDIEDSMQLEKFITPEDMKRLETRTSQISTQELQTLFKQLDASDWQRFQALQKQGNVTEPANNSTAHTQLNTTPAEQLASDRRRIELLNQETRLHHANMRRASEGIDFMGAIDSNFTVKYSYTKPKKNDRYDSIDFLSDI